MPPSPSLPPYLGVGTTNFYPTMKYNLFQERFEYQSSPGIDFIQTNNDKEYLPLTSSQGMIYSIAPCLPTYVGKAIVL